MAQMKDDQAKEEVGRMAEQSRKVNIRSSRRTRTRVGLEIQRRVIAQLRSLGEDILEARNDDEEGRGIDFWWKMDDGEYHSVQFKYRQSGDDLLYELLYDVDTEEDGRDMKGESEFYLWIDTHGVGRLVKTDLIRQLTPEMLKAYHDRPYRKVIDGDGWQLWNLPERGEYNDAGVERIKLIAYVKPSSVDVLWEAQFRL
jgi:hypothetical protein